ncbi:CobW family GTP-binding protein [Kineococcus terrestris]|uniref:CobW family GTP-binding protein n=1 Tax=Kineococcus terrestris TaxID=2044856 RepID=UPI0034DAE5C9
MPLAPLPVTVLTCLDPVLRDTATAVAAWEVPGTVVLRYDLGPGRDDGLRRVVSDVHGVEEDVRVPLEHACLDCALREDVLPALVAVAASGRWRRVVLALPLAAEPLVVVRALRSGEVDGRPVADACRVASVVATADAAALEDDLLGDDLLAERLPALAGVLDDGRAVGEALAHQLDEADLVLLAGERDAPAGRARRLLAHLSTAPVREVHAVTGAELVADRWAGRPDAAHDPGRDAPLELRRARPTGALDGDGVWTLELSSRRAFHPGRLLEGIEEVGSGRLRARGVFHLPSRPGVVCAWDGAGGQLSIGEVGGWDAAGPRTRLVVTGTDPADRERVAACFPRLLLRADEHERFRPGTPDGFEPWLGAAGADVPHVA